MRNWVNGTWWKSAPSPVSKPSPSRPTSRIRNPPYDLYFLAIKVFFFFSFSSSSSFILYTLSPIFPITPNCWTHQGLKCKKLTVTQENRIKSRIIDFLFSSNNLRKIVYVHLRFLWELCLSKGCTRSFIQTRNRHNERPTKIQPTVFQRTISRYDQH